jgi:DNA-binding protein H-NS
MSSQSTSLASIAERRAKLAEELRVLEEQEASLRQQATAEAFSQIIALLVNNAVQFDSKQRAEIAGHVISTARARKPASSTKPKKEVAPKYWLPHTQETWSGRGRTPKAFTAWEGTSAYNDWKKNHPGEKFPKFPG